MDELCWTLFEQLRQLIDTFEQFHQAPCVHPDILHTYPSGAMDMILALDSIIWSGLDFNAPMLFQHPGIACSTLVKEPVEHFVIHGFPDAVQHCVMRAMLYSLMEELRRIFNRMTLRGETLLPPCPPLRPTSTHPVEGTIRIQPEHQHLRHRDQRAQVPSSVGCAPVPHFTSMGGALMALQQFVATMSADSAQIHTDSTSTPSGNRLPMLPSNTTPPAQIEELIIPLEEHEPVPPVNPSLWSPWGLLPCQYPGQTSLYLHQQPPW
jgi:hypothetical protein